MKPDEQEKSFVNDPAVVHTDQFLIPLEGAISLERKGRISIMKQQGG